MDKGIKNYTKLLFSPIFTGVLFIIFVIAMAVATFVENDYGAPSARQLIYNSRWFELVFLLMLVNMMGQIINFKLYRREKLTVLLFHIAFIVMIIGAGITRYLGFEGVVHIREGQTVSHGMSRDKYMGLEIADKEGNIVYDTRDKMAVNNTSLGEFYRSGKVEGVKYSVRYSRYIPNAIESLVDVQEGSALASVLISKGMFKEDIIIGNGERIKLPDATMEFSINAAADINLLVIDNKFFLSSSDTITRFNMMTKEESHTLPGTPVEFIEMGMYMTMGYRVVAQQLKLNGAVIPVMAEDNAVTGKNAFEIEIAYGDQNTKTFVYDVVNGEATNSTAFLDGLRFKLSYGPERIEFPFSLKLEDFIMDRYPGSSSPMGYQSDIILVDKDKGINTPYSIYMNNILKHRGFRFFQSYYDQDEKGTILSMNHDLAGMLVTYTGYGLLFLFIILSTLNRKSVFWQVSPSLWKNSSSKILGIIIFLLLIPGALQANPTKIVFDKDKSAEFGKVLVQDQKGRTKPIYTLSNDILRKVYRHNTYKDYSPMQVFLGLTTDFQNWQDEALIKVSSKELRSVLGFTAEYVAITDLVDFNTGTYKLSNIIEAVYTKPQSQRSKMDKEVIKVDERVNIIMMIARGEFLRMFPLRDGTLNWGTPGQALPNALNEQDSTYINSILSLYTSALFEGLQNGNYAQTDQYLDSILDYQRAFAGYDLPSERQVKAEILYYRLLIFEKLFPFYATVGLVMMVILIAMIVAGRTGKSYIVSGLSLLVIGGFLFHTFGLGIRWYISGHSPMSNGYESLLFISWVTVIVGLAFGRKSSLTLAATAVLASLTLMVAHLSFMDPEITPLVPVLQSYWLTLHVSVITASYGFLGLGAILGLTNMILYTLNTKKSRRLALISIDELSVISYRSLTLGLYFLTIGTFLGAVWANESWGRYWGWDPKETWSLITMMVYAFVLHAKNIKGLKSIFTYNVMSVWAFSSVLMTYFGVNYYLSGLHSYAGGDSVPIPSFVYYTLAILLALSYISYSKYRKLAPKV